MPLKTSRSEPPVPVSSSQTGPARWVLVGALVLVLLVVGVYDDAVFAVLTSTLQKLLAAVGLYQPAAAAQQNVDANVTHRYVPAGIAYAGLYVGMCLALLRLLLPVPAQWRLVLRLYAGTIAAYVLLVLLGRAMGNVVWVYRLARHLLDFVVSPLPVAGLYVLFRAGFGPTAPGGHSQKEE